MSKAKSEGSFLLEGLEGQEFKPCSREGLCPTLNAAIEATETSKAKTGFFRVIKYRMIDGSARMWLLGVKWEAPKGQGFPGALLINHCPWCGTEIVWEDPPDKEAERLAGVTNDA